MSSEIENLDGVEADTRPSAGVNPEQVLSAARLNLILAALFGYFGARLLFLACTISPAAPPDEVTHAGLCQVFSTTWLFPVNSPETYQYGLVTNIPWLYYWTMGKLLSLNHFGLTELTFLRLLNIPLALGTAWYILRLLRLFTCDRLTQVLLVVMVTNTAMLSFVSASVSSDNLTNLFAAMAIYYLFAFFRQRAGSLLALSLLCQLAGCLTKVTFLPLVLLLGLLLLWHEAKGLPRLLNTAVLHFRGARPVDWFIAVAILLALGLNLRLYGGNYIAYKLLNPTLEQVAPENVMRYRITARETVFRLYTAGEISYMDAVIMAGDIQHPGDKADTFYMLMNYENLKKNPGLWMGPVQYAKVWVESMAASVFGIKAHLQMFKSPGQLVPVYLLMLCSAMGFLLRWRPRKEGWLPACLAALACCYAGYIMYRINYGAYLYYGTPGVTLNGRYLFPVISPFFVLSSLYLLRLFRTEPVRLGVTLAASLLFIAYDFPWFLVHAAPEWYA